MVSDKHYAELKDILEVAREVKEWLDHGESQGKPFPESRITNKGSGEIAYLHLVFNSMLNSLAHTIKKKEAALEELREQRDILEYLNDELETANIELERYASTAAHTIRAPIVNMKNAAEVLLEYTDAGQDEQSQKLLGIILRGAQRSAEQIGELYKWSKVTQQSDYNEKVELDVVMKDLTSVLLSEQIRASNTKINSDVSDLAVRGNKSQIIALLQNLLHNAIKYSFDGRDPVISVSAHLESDDMVRLKVEDNGKGIKAEDLPKIFQMYARADEKRASKSLGIGLSHCKKIVHKNGGQISVSSKYGEGSVFSVTIPAWKE